MFPDEKMLIQNHILLHAIHKSIYLDILKDKSRLEREKQILKEIKATDYVRSWEIVEERGHENIINEFKERCGI